MLLCSVLTYYQKAFLAKKTKTKKWKYNQLSDIIANPPKTLERLSSPHKKNGSFDGSTLYKKLSIEITLPKQSVIFKFTASFTNFSVTREFKIEDIFSLAKENSTISLSVDGSEGLVLNAAPLLSLLCTHFLNKG